KAARARLWHEPCPLAPHTTPGSPAAGGDDEAGERRSVWSLRPFRRTPGPPARTRADPQDPPRAGGPDGGVRAPAARGAAPRRHADLRVRGVRACAGGDAGGLGGRSASPRLEARSAGPPSGRLEPEPAAARRCWRGGRGARAGGRQRRITPQAMRPPASPAGWLV